jgi:hypothetical protein
MYRESLTFSRPAAHGGLRMARICLAAALALPLVPVIALAGTPSAVALGDGLALTPPMGWNDWNAYGCNVSEQLVEQTALATTGTKVEIWSGNGGANQQWQLNANGTITGVQSGLCLDVTGASTNNGALAELWTCNGGSNQEWTLG